MRQRGLYAAQAASSSAGSMGDGVGCTRRSRSVRARGRGTRERERAGEMARGRARDNEWREMASCKRSAKIPSEGSRMTRGMDKRGRWRDCWLWFSHDFSFFF
jgi:hypothetical protein